MSEFVFGLGDLKSAILSCFAFSMPSTIIPRGYLYIGSCRRKIPPYLTYRGKYFTVLYNIIFDDYDSGFYMLTQDGNTTFKETDLTFKIKARYIKIRPFTNSVLRYYAQGAFHDVLSTSYSSQGRPCFHEGLNFLSLFDSYSLLYCATSASYFFPWDIPLHVFQLEIHPTLTSCSRSTSLTPKH